MHVGSPPKDLTFGSPETKEAKRILKNKSGHEAVFPNGSKLLIQLKNLAGYPYLENKFDIDVSIEGKFRSQFGKGLLDC